MRGFPNIVLALHLSGGLLLGCSFGGGVPVGESRDAGKPPTSVDSGTDATILLPDAGTLDAAVADSAVEAGASSPVRHASCALPEPSHLPPAPRLAVDASGRPAFDRYRNIGCDEAAAFATCTPSAECEGTPRCILLEEHGVGVCADEGPFYPAMSFDGGRCVTRRQDVAHARACCDQLPGFDCRAWPYPQNSAPGQACARHDDCEPGLVCTAREDFAVCVCPDLDPVLAVPWC